MNFDELYENYPQLRSFLLDIPQGIKARCAVKRLCAGTTVVKRKDRLKYVYVLVDGEIKVVSEFENGSIYAFASIFPLSFIGELEVLSEEKEYAVTIEAMTECLIIQINAVDFAGWIEADAGVLLQVARGLAKKMYPTSSEMGNIMFQSSKSKVEYYLAKYCNQKIKDSELLKVEKNRQEIADEIGSSIKTVNRNIKKLKEEGLVSVKKGKIFVSKAQHQRLMEAIKLENKGSL